MLRKRLYVIKSSDAVQLRSVFPHQLTRVSQACYLEPVDWLSCWHVFASDWATPYKYWNMIQNNWQAKKYEIFLLASIWRYLLKIYFGIWMNCYHFLYISETNLGSRFIFSWLWIYNILWYYAASSCNSVPEFRDSILVSSSRVKTRLLDPWRWDRYVVPKGRDKITTVRFVISKKSADIIYIAAEAWNHAFSWLASQTFVYRKHNSCLLTPWLTCWLRDVIWIPNETIQTFLFVTTN
jgi:hypothetical protein